MFGVVLLFISHGKSKREQQQQIKQKSTYIFKENLKRDISQFGEIKLINYSFIQF